MKSIYWYILLSLSIVFAIIAGLFARVPESIELSYRDTNDPRISRLISNIEIAPDAITPYIDLGHMYLQRVRETFDTSYYQDIEQLLVEARTIDASNPEVIALEASIYLGRHEFAQALEKTQQLLKTDANRAAYLGLHVDALIELGRYDEAQESLQRMVNAKPNFASYSRIAYLREIFGDREGAIGAMQDTISAGGIYPENLAWAYTELGRLQFAKDPIAAERSFTQALEVLPSYAPAKAGLGKALYFQGKQEEGRVLLEEAYNLLPINSYAISLADAYSLQGNQSKSDELHILAMASFIQSETTRQNIDLDLAKYLAIQNPTSPDFFSRAEKAYAAAPSVQTASVLAYAHYINADLNKAKEKIDEALRLNTQDPTTLYRAALIYRDLEQIEEAILFIDQANESFNFDSMLTAQAAADLQATIN